MGNSKVIFGNETLIDLTGDTVTPDTLLAGTTAHNRSGNQIVGTATVPDTLDDLTDVELTSPAEGDLLQYDATEQKWVNSAKIPQKVAGLQATGCVNILPNDGVSSVINGVTITVNANKSVTLNGTASGTVSYDLYGTSADFIDFDFAGLEKMILSGGSELSSNVQLCLDSKDSQGSTLAQVSTTGVGVEFTKGDRKKICAWIYVRNGTTVNNVTVYPMIYPAGLGLDVPYVPYSMTNRELTEAVTPVKLNPSLNTSYFNNPTALKVYRCGNIVNVTLYARTSAQIPNANVYLTTGAAFPTPVVETDPLGFAYDLDNKAILGQVRIMNGDLNFPFNPVVPVDTSFRINLTYFCQ